MYTGALGIPLPSWPVCLFMYLQPVPEMMRLEMVIGMEIRILQGQGVFSNKPFEKRPVMIIQDSDFHCDDHFDSHIFGSGLYQCA